MRYTKKTFAELKDVIEKRGKGITVVIGNQKGGVGKTANATIMSYILAKHGIKTLVVDLDPQANASETLVHTMSRNSEDGKIPAIKKTILLGISEGDLTDLPVKIMDNLYLLPSYIDFEGFTEYLYEHTNNEYERNHFLKPLLDPLKEDYDVIILDMPPLMREIRDNAVVLSDYVLIVLQTQEHALVGAKRYIKKLIELRHKYDLPVDLLGVIGVLNNRRGRVDKIVLDEAKRDIGEDLVFETVVPNMERIKRFPIQGVGEDDRFDTQVLDVYRKITTEFAKRLTDAETRE